MDLCLSACVSVYACACMSLYGLCVSLCVCLYMSLCVYMRVSLSREERNFWGRGPRSHMLWWFWVWDSRGYPTLVCPGVLGPDWLGKGSWESEWLILITQGPVLGWGSRIILLRRTIRPRLPLIFEGPRATVYMKVCIAYVYIFTSLKWSDSPAWPQGSLGFVLVTWRLKEPQRLLPASGIQDTAGLGLGWLLWVSSGQELHISQLRHLCRDLSFLKPLYYPTKPEFSATPKELLVLEGILDLWCRGLSESYSSVCST